MTIIDYGHAAKNILISVKGHPYQRDEFFAMFNSMDSLSYTAVEQPASQLFFSAAASTAYDAHVLYDMPGIDFNASPPTFVDPGEQFKADFLGLLEQGHGFVFLHHSISSWPTWPEYAEIVGGKFLYLPRELRGKACLDSGYRHDVAYRATVVNDHPVTKGVSSCFDVTDELYLCEIFADDVMPILVSDYAFNRDNFYSASHAANGAMYSNKDWFHEDGSNLIGWVKHYKNSPVVYLQMGDGPAAYGNSQYRKLLENAINWVASDEALAWAKNKNSIS